MKKDTEREKFNQWLRIKHCGAAHDLAWEAWKARAALEAKQAPVQMPEPAAYLYHDAPMLADFITNERAAIHINSALFSVKRHPNCRNETPLYTDQQLRALLAQHGIKIAD